MTQPTVVVYYEFVIKRNKTIGVPVCRSQSIREVTILPYGANISSISLCVMLRGSPLTYRLAPLILSLLGRASDTYERTTNHTFAISVRRIELSILLIYFSKANKTCNNNILSFTKPGNHKGKRQSWNGWHRFAFLQMPIN